MQRPAPQRKQACLGCRRRKKKCDGGKPSCLLCRKWKAPCEYPGRLQNLRNTPANLPQASNIIENTGIEQEYPPWTLGPNATFFSSSSEPPDLLETLSHPLTGTQGLCDGEAWDDLMSYNMQYNNIPSIPIDLNNSVTATEASSSSTTNNGFPVFDSSQQQDDTKDFRLPPKPNLLELSRIFFDQHAHFIPCILRGPLLDMIAATSHEDLQQSSLIHVIIAIAAQGHPDPTIRERQTAWLTKCNELWAAVETDPSVSLQALQTGCCLTFLEYSAGNYTSAFLSLGKTWRLACSMRLNNLDAAPTLPQRNDVKELRADPRRRDECRRILWVLFILDRALSFPSGLSHAIDDRQFIVDLPRSNSCNESMVGSDMTQPIPFTRNALGLLRSTSASPGTTSVFCYVLQAYIILGRITEHITSLDLLSSDEADSEEAALKSLISQFRLGLPRSATNIAAAPPAEYINVVWLNAILTIHAISFHHRKITKNTPSEECPSQSPQESTGLSPTPTSNSDGASEGQPNEERTDNFGYCIIAAQSMVQLIRDISCFSIGPLLNPHLIMSFYFCAQTLTIEWLETRDAVLRQEIDVLLTLFDRIQESFPNLGGKCRKVALWNLNKDAESGAAMKRSGARVIVDCRRQ